MTNDFSNKVALVTGAASGIGVAIATRLASEGAKLIIADRDASGASSVVNAIKQTGGEASIFEIDVADPLEVEAMVAFAEKTYGGLHLAVNNAGIGGRARPPRTILSTAGTRSSISTSTVFSSA